MISTYFQKCIFAFYLLGQNSYNLRANKFRVWLQHIPRIFFLVLIITGICCHLLIERSVQRPITLVNYIKFIMAISINALVFLDYFLMPNGVRKLNYAYKDVIDYLERKLYVKVDYEPFKRTFQCKVRMVLLVFLLIFGIKMLFTLFEEMDSTEMAQFFIYYLKQFVLMHILFHIEFAHFLMQQINAEFNPMTKLLEFSLQPIQPKTIELLLTLRHCKHIHFRVWEIFRILNFRFGWILIALVLAIVLDISYSTYWMWVYVHMHKSTNETITLHRITRKYLLILFF